MGKLTITNINVESLLSYKEPVSKLSSGCQIDSLNASLLYNKEEDSLYLSVREANSSFAQVKVCASILPENVEGNIGISIGTVPLFNVLSTLDKTTAEQLVIEIDTGDNSQYKLSLPNKTYNFLYKVMSEDSVKEYLEPFGESFKNEASTDPSFQLSLFNDGKENFLRGIDNCSMFLCLDDKKNNAFAVYNDKIVVNDNRHVFLFSYDNPVVFMKDSPVSIHKKAAKFFLILRGKGIDFDALVSSDQKKVFIMAPNFVAILNNSMSNIYPPSEEDLNEIRSDNKLCSFVAKDIFTITEHLKQFFSSNMEFNPVTLNISSKGVSFTIKSTGMSGQATNLVDLLLPYSEENKNVKNMSVTVINDSLRDFTKGSKDDLVEVYVDDIPEHKAVYFKSSKKEIYLAKLGG